MMEIMHTSDMVKVKRSRSLVREEPGATRMYQCINLHGKGNKSNYLMDHVPKRQ